MDRILDKYEVTVVDRDPRYINYWCYAEWSRGNFASAMNWGKRGEDLRTTTGVDTSFDTTHNYALALRDAGRPEAALPIFLRGRKLVEVTNPEELEREREGHYYGNIGRCLHFMGQIEEALACYQKSALLLETSRFEHVTNQGFVRAWIAELLLARSELKLAYIFYRAAYLKWRQSSPPRALQPEQFSIQLRDRLSPGDLPDDSTVERMCRGWILGRRIDSLM